MAPVARSRTYRFKNSQLREETGKCRTCDTMFTFMMTTKPRVFCDACKERVAEEGKKRRSANRKSRSKKLAAMPVQKKLPKLIPYAGYDGS